MCNKSGKLGLRTVHVVGAFEYLQIETLLHHKRFHFLYGAVAAWDDEIRIHLAINPIKKGIRLSEELAPAGTTTYLFKKRSWQVPTLHKLSPTHPPPTSG